MDPSQKGQVNHYLKTKITNINFAVVKFREKKTG